MFALYINHENKTLNYDTAVLCDVVWNLNSSAGMQLLTPNKCNCFLRSGAIYYYYYRCVRLFNSCKFKTNSIALLLLLSILA